MKVERTKGFEPVTITLDTQEEVNVFAAIYGVNGSLASSLISNSFRTLPSRNDICNVFQKLHPLNEFSTNR